MSSLVVRHGVVAGLGAAAGALAAAALMTTAPIASALPVDGSDSTFTIALGDTTYSFDTTWDGTGLPTTVETTTAEPTGTEAFGFSDTSTSDFTIGTTSYETEFASALFDTFSATGNTFEFVPLELLNVS